MMLPTRSCLACRQRTEKSALIRLTAVGGTVRVDSTATLPGRGAYVCDRAECLDAALNRGAARLLRALRQTAGQITVDDEAIRAAWRQARPTATSSTRGTRSAAGVSE